MRKVVNIIWTFTTDILCLWLYLILISFVVMPPFIFISHSMSRAKYHADILLDDGAAQIEEEEAFFEEIAPPPHVPRETFGRWL